MYEKLIARKNSDGVHLHFGVFYASEYSDYYRKQYNVNPFAKYNCDDVRSGSANTTAECWNCTWSEGNNPNPLFVLNGSTFVPNSNYIFSYANGSNPKYRSTQYNSNPFIYRKP